MNDMRIEPQWLVTAAALLVLGTGGYMAYGAYQRRTRYWFPMEWAVSSISITCC